MNIFFSFFLKKIFLGYNWVNKIIYLLKINTMEKMNVLTSTTTKMTSLLEKISSTCDALISALEFTTEEVSQYGGGIVHSFDSEYVDVVIRTLLQLRAHAKRLAKEINNGLITSSNDLMLLFEGMQDIDDKLVELMQKNAFIRNNFEYWLNEIRELIEEIKDSVVIN